MFTFTGAGGGIFTASQITVKDLANMERDDLYDFGVRGFRNAKLILERAGSYSQRILLKQGSWSQEERRPPRLVRQESRDYDGEYTAFPIVVGL